MPDRPARPRPAPPARRIAAIPAWLGRALLVGALLLPAPCLSASELADLESLLQHERYAAAFEWAQQRRAEREGEPRFDFLYGIAATETGHYGEAVFALRRVLAVDPRPVIRLQLARAWLLLGEDRQARRELERVLADEPPEPLRARAERYLHALDGRAARYRTAVRGHVELGAGGDSNVATATDADSVELASGPVALPDALRARADDFTRLGGELRLSRPLRPGLHLFGELSGERRDHAEHTDFETAQGQLRTGLAWSGDAARTEIAARHRRYHLGGDHYRDTTGLDARVRYALSAVQVAEAALGFSQLRHARSAQRARDSDLATLVVGATRLWRVRLRPTLSAFVLYGEQDAVAEGAPATDREGSMRAAAERALYGAGADLRLTLAPRWLLRGGLRMRRSDYAETDPYFERVRRDDFRSAELALQWHPRLSWRLQALISRRDNDSNFGLYEYEREVAELSLRYQF